MLNIEEKNINHLQEQIRITEIEIDLVGAEGCPDQLLAGSGLKAGQEGKRPGPENPGDIGALRNHDEVIPVSLLSLQKTFEPEAPGRYMVQDQVEHEPEILPDGGDLRPATPIRIDLFIIDHRKTVIRRIGGKRENMYSGNYSSKMFFQKRAQGFKERLSPFSKLVPIGYEDRIPFIQGRTARRRRCGRFGSLDPRAVAFQEPLQMLKCFKPPFPPVKKIQMFFYFFVHRIYFKAR